MNGKERARAHDRTIGARVRRERKARGYTIEQIGEILGISYQQVQKYESGANRISAGKLALLAEELGISFDDLLSISENDHSTVDPKLLRLLQRAETALGHDRIIQILKVLV